MSGHEFACARCGQVYHSHATAEELREEAAELGLLSSDPAAKMDSICDDCHQLLMAWLKTAEGQAIYAEWMALGKP
jgi:hypothetical protein